MPKSSAFQLIAADNGAVAIYWLGEDPRSAAELLTERRSNLGEMSCRIGDYVNARSATRTGDVTQEFGINSGALFVQHARQL
jgi:hypothetical protein